jgi:histidinol-phosphate/aromatic aminotransferase/cobyric acid decarboxylase-like protein
VQEVLATPEAQRQAKAMGVDLERMKAAVPHLSDAELADLAKRAASAKDVVAGHGGDEGLVLLALILLLAGLAILVAVSDYDDYWDDCYCW